MIPDFLHSMARKETRRATMIIVQQIKREKATTDAKLYDLALSLIEHRARAILSTHHNLDEFVMGMGAWLFTRRNSEDSISDVYRDRIPAYVLPFARMMDEFHAIDLKVTGEPMRFTARGPVVTSWGGTDGLDGRGVAEKYGNEQSACG